MAILFLFGSPACADHLPWEWYLPRKGEGCAYFFNEPRPYPRTNVCGTPARIAAHCGGDTFVTMGSITSDVLGECSPGFGGACTVKLPGRKKEEELEKGKGGDCLEALARCAAENGKGKVQACADQDPAYGADCPRCEDFGEEAEAGAGSGQSSLGGESVSGGSAGFNFQAAPAGR